MRRIFFALPLLVGFAACIDFGNLIGGEHDSTPNDAGSPDAFIVDAGVQESGFDDVATPPLIDASFCASSDASFCDDFDTVALAVRWSSRTTRSGGTIDSIALPGAPSSPNVLYATLPDASAATEFTRDAYISRTFSGTFTHFDIGFDVLMVQVDTNSAYGAVLPIAIYSPDQAQNPPNYLTFYYYQSKAYAYEQHGFPDGGSVSYQPGGNWFDIPQVGRWHRLDLAIDLGADGGAPTLTVTLDNVVVEQAALSKLWTLGPTIGLSLGITYPYGTLSGWQIAYDNVTVNTY